MATEWYFDESKYDGSTPWVPLADISEEEWKALPKHVQASVEGLPYFRKTKPAATKQFAAEKET